MCIKKTLTSMPDLEKKSAVMLPDSPWKKLLVWNSAQQDRAIFPPNNLFDDLWVEIGPGYVIGDQTHVPSFGHWDLVQTAMNALPYAPEYAKVQLKHYLSVMYPDGMLPGTLWGIRGSENNDIRLPRTPLQYSHPPFWQEFVSDYYAKTGDKEFLAHAFEKGKLNYHWWKQERSALEGGFYYVDIVKRWWESGVDAGVRWDNVDGQAHACIDASCHIYSLVNRLAQWAEILGEDPSFYRKEAETNKAFINTELWDEETGFFYDVLPCRGQKEKVMTIAGFWPLAFGIATEDQQKKLMEHLLNPKKFFTVHPIPSVAIDEEKFCHSYWRGPSWTGPAYWILRGMNRSGLKKEAQMIGEKILNGVNYHFEKDHTVYEFYPPMDHDLCKLGRNPLVKTAQGPCHDYLGHNPLNALYWELFGK